LHGASFDHFGILQMPWMILPEQFR
jgi:hypothetical protein